MRPQSSIFHLSPFSSSRHGLLLCRPVFTPNSQHCHHLPTRRSLRRNHHPTLNPDELRADELKPSPSTSSQRPSSTLTSHERPPSTSEKRISSDSYERRLIHVTNNPVLPWGHIRILRLDDWETRNSISWKMLRELQHQIELVREQGDLRDWDETVRNESRTSEIEHHTSAAKDRGKNEGNETDASSRAVLGPTRILIVASQFKVFSAGANLTERANMTVIETEEFLAALRSTLKSLTSLNVPSMSAVAGPAHGGGLELALATDIRVFTTQAVVSLPETRLGIIPGAGGTYRLGEIIGKSLALELILTGRAISGSEAYSYGLCQRLVKVPAGAKKGHNTVLNKAIQIAEEICAGGPLAVQAALRAVKAGTADAESSEYQVVLKTEDRKRALAAFLVKEKPKFHGN